MKSEPRYVQLAAKLRGAIRRGAYPVGSYLPTEHDLCARHSVSRHTAREALRLLLEEGLIERRRGAGTVVIEPAAAPTFSQPLGSVEDLLQYANDARLQVSAVATLKERDPLRGALRLPAEEPYVTISGLRALANTPPVASTRIVVRREFAPSAQVLAGLKGALTEWIAATHGVVFSGIQQEISASLLDEATAHALGADTGAAALCTRRWYMLDEAKIALASDTIHPADRFVYQMNVSRHTASSGRD